jgi:hypothetical protein
MPENLYLVDPNSKQLTAVTPVSLAAIGIRERQDLEAWVTEHPEMLGEELLVITTEFDRFDRSDRRLDVLALDRNGVLVVIELKLELSRSFADQQAIRYAAFCSTMTMDQVVTALASFEGCTPEEATTKILTFLDADELPELEAPPRIILAAGSLDDEELTSTVLWLRTFGVDITCVEMTPYQLSPNGQLAMVPRTIIPLPEAKNYLVQVEQKQVARVKRAREAGVESRLWQLIADSFNALGLQFHVKAPPNSTWMKVPIGHRDMHYEWKYLRREPILSVALHFEAQDRAVNQPRLDLIAHHRNEIVQGIDYQFLAEPWGKQWAAAQFRVPYNPSEPLEVAPEAVRIMQLLIGRTWPLIEPIVKESAS